MQYEVNGETWRPWTDINNWYRDKFTREQLDQAVKDGHVRTIEIPIEDTPYTFTAYNEYDVAMAVARGKFKPKVEFERFF